MLLDSFGAVLAFFLFVAPGLLWDLLTDRRRSAAHRSTFTEIGVVALASTILTTLSTLIVLLVAEFVFDSPWVESVSQMVDTSLGAAGGGAVSIVGPFSLLGIELFVALLLAIAADGVLGQKWWGPKTRNLSGWVDAIRNHGQAFDKPLIIATVTMQGASTGFRGEVEKYSNDLDMNRRELVLVSPIVRIWFDEFGREEARSETQDARLVIPGREIASVGFVYGKR